MKCKRCEQPAVAGSWLLCRTHKKEHEQEQLSPAIKEKPALDHIPTWGEMMTAAKRNHNTAAAILDQTSARLQSAQFDHEEAKALEDQ